jgi:hypothetical protein
MEPEFRLSTGTIIVLVGMILLLVANFYRRAARRRGGGREAFLGRWGAVIAFCCLGVGLLLLLKK